MKTETEVVLILKFKAYVKSCSLHKYYLNRLNLEIPNLLCRALSNL